MDDTAKQAQKDAIYPGGSIRSPGRTYRARDAQESVLGPLAGIVELIN